MIRQHINVLSAKYDNEALKVKIQYRGGKGDRKFEFKIIPKIKDHMQVMIGVIGPENDEYEMVEADLHHYWTEEDLPFVYETFVLKLIWNDGHDFLELRKPIETVLESVRNDLLSGPLSNSDIRKLVGQVMGTAPTSRKLDSLRKDNICSNWTKAHWNLFLSAICKARDEKKWKERRADGYPGIYWSTDNQSKSLLSWYSKNSMTEIPLILNCTIQSHVNPSDDPILLETLYKIYKGDFSPHAGSPEHQAYCYITLENDVSPREISMTPYRKSPLQIVAKPVGTTVL